jgi:hypothetical protein
LETPGAGFAAANAGKKPNPDIAAPMTIALSRLVLIFRGSSQVASFLAELAGV